jgi:hypothetical protein
MPTNDIKILLKQPIPPATFLHDLEKEFGQAWFDGARSIVDHKKDAEIFMGMLSRENKFMDAMRSFRKRGQMTHLEDDD